MVYNHIKYPFQYDFSNMTQLTTITTVNYSNYTLKFSINLNNEGYDITCISINHCVEPFGSILRSRWQSPWGFTVLDLRREKGLFHSRK